jgi:hypothetical protein
MKYIKLTILAAFLSTMFTGCSYVSDYVEGAITDRASFSVKAEYDGSNVILKWDETDSSDNFAGIEIYRTSKANDEYSRYELVASRYENNNLINGNLDTGSTVKYTDQFPPSNGIYFYRVGIIHIEDDDDDNPYDASYEPEYNQYTNLNAISGYGRVEIP